MTLTNYPDLRMVEPEEWILRVTELRKNDITQFQNLQNNQSYRSSFRPAFETITTGRAVGRGDYTLIGDTTAGSITMTLPDVVDYAGFVYVFKKISASNNYVIDGDGANIDGSATVTLTANNSSRTIQSDGTQWRILATI